MGNSWSLLHSWQRGANPPTLWRPHSPLYCLLSLFQILSNLPPPWLPCHLQPSPPLFFLLSFFFGWIGDHATFDVLFCVMIIWIYTCRALVPLYQKDLNVCFMQQRAKFTEVWHVFSILVLWFDITHTHKHTQLPRTTARTHTQINIYSHHLLCAHSSYLYYIKWLMFKTTHLFYGLLYFYGKNMNPPFFQKTQHFLIVIFIKHWVAIK